MKYAASVKQLIDGRWYARSESTPVGLCEATGGDRAAALEQLRKEIRYRLEWCPCSGVADELIELDVRQEPRARWQGGW